MLQWIGEFPLAEGADFAALLSAAKTWLVGSPHHSWDAEWFEAGGPLFVDRDEGIWEHRHGGERVIIQKVTDDKDSWLGFRFIWADGDSREWTVEMVSHATGAGAKVSIKLDCHALVACSDEVSSQKPRLITTVIKKVGGGWDGRIRVWENPHYLQEPEVKRAVEILTGEYGNTLPIVYVSMPWRPPLAVDVARLGRKLSGLAHVIVEPSPHFSYAMAPYFGYSSPRGGTVGIFWPDLRGSQTHIERSANFTEVEFEEHVVSLIRNALVKVRPNQLTTWAAIQDAASRTGIEKLKQSNSTEIEQYCELHDQEVLSIREQLSDANIEVGRLRAEIGLLDARLAKAGESFPVLDKEQPYYPHEIQDIVLKTLQLGAGQLQANARCAHVIAEILELNSVSEEGQQLQTEIKNILSRENRLGEQDLARLRHLGFSISEDGKHYKAVFRDDERYTFSIAKTPSDHRTMKNQASVFLGKLFR